MKRGALIAVAVLLILGVLITGLVFYFNKEVAYKNGVNKIVQ